LVKHESEEHKQLKQKLEQCKTRMSSDPGHVDYGVCEAVLSHILAVTKKGGGDDACINMYDIRLRDSYPSCGMNWPPDLEYVKPYLRKLEVAAALHVNPSRNTGWQECNGAVGSAFNVKNSKPSIEILPDIIKEVPTLLFSGAEDLICNHVGTEKLIENMSWNGAKGFNSKGSEAPQRNWTVEGKTAGYWQEARNLTYVLIEDSSHMVPFDYPRRSRDMLDRFMGVDFEMLAQSRIDSKLDGERPLESGASEKPKTDEDDDEKDKKVEEAKWAAYRRSGEVVLFITVVVASVWGFFVWRDRRRRARYSAVDSDDPAGRGFRSLGRKRGQGRAGDLEASAFDESELDDLHVQTPTAADGSKYALGDDSDDEDVDEKRQRQGAPSKASGSGSA
jgi:carboxypeptidase D